MQFTCIGFGDNIKDYELSELQNEAELIIYGETVDYKCYMFDPGFIRTIEQIKIKECISGGIEIGEIVEVRRTGGYVLARDYLESFRAEDRANVRVVDLKDLTDEQIETEYISQFTYGDANLSIGKIISYEALVK